MGDFNIDIKNCCLQKTTSSLISFVISLIIKMLSNNEYVTLQTISQL